MSIRSASAVFRQIEFGGEAEKADGLFRAAISAFCALSRPTRREVSQLDDLAQPLFGSVSNEARRFAAAALSECEFAPPELVRRLCNQPAEIAAPLLVRSVVLKDIDLIALIGRHGIGHARAIYRRSPLNPAIGRLISALLAHAEKPPINAANAITESARQGPPSISENEDAAEQTRSRLRTMMQPAGARGRDPLVTLGPTAASFATLCSAALTGKQALFQTALADALGISFIHARRLTEGDSSEELLIALKALGLKAEQAFLLAVLAMPACFSRTERIRQFVERFQSLTASAAVKTVREWNPHFATAGPAAKSVPLGRSEQDNIVPARTIRLKAS